MQVVCRTQCRGLKVPRCGFFVGACGRFLPFFLKTYPTGGKTFRGLRICNVHLQKALRSQNKTSERPPKRVLVMGNAMVSVVQRSAGDHRADR